MEPIEAIAYNRLSTAWRCSTTTTSSSNNERAKQQKRRQVLRLAWRQTQRKLIDRQANGSILNAATVWHLSRFWNKNNSKRWLQQLHGPAWPLRRDRLYTGTQCSLASTVWTDQKTYSLIGQLVCAVIILQWKREWAKLDHNAYRVI